MDERQRRILGIALFVAPLLLIVILIVAFALGRDDGKPSIEILSPPDGHSVVLGETLYVESQAQDDAGISEVELYVNGALIHVAKASPGKSFTAMQSWLPTAAGAFDVMVTAFNDEGQVSASATIRVVVELAPAPTLPPAETPTATSTPEGPVGPDGCTYDAVFVTDVTIPDNTQLAPGTEFVKTWRLRNSGTCDWGEGFQLVFVGGGDQMSAPAAVSAPPAAVGATVDVSVRFMAPQEPGTYRARWRMRTPDGQDFGDRPFVQIVVPAPATPTPQVTPTATPGPKPDLDITLVAGNLDLGVGELLELRVTVKNHGPGVTEQPTLVRVVLRAGLELQVSVPTLSLGAQEVVVLRHTFEAPADLDVFISVDPDGEIVEADETNNTERIPIVVNPPLYATRTITTTPGLSFDLDDGLTETLNLDVEWRVVEGTVYVGLLNGTGAALLSGEAESVSYALAAGLAWQTEQLLLADLTEGALFGLRTSDGRVGYARVAEVLDAAYTSVRLDYWLWDWP